MRGSLTACAILSALLPPLACRALAGDVDLSPERWERQRYEEAFARNDLFGPEVGEGRGRSILIAGTTGPPAIQAGYEALRQGGSAADAVLTAALSQIALAGGSWVSYAGLFTMVYYEAETGGVHSLCAAFAIPRGETDPGTIPAQGSGEPSGRTALVPGFMAGVEAAHRRFGRLPFEEIFAPAIHFAEEGFALPPHLAAMIERRREVLARLPETRRVFEREDGAFLREGDWFRQEELAATLRAVASQGAGHMYTGPWAERLVEIVRREGGLMTLEDLAAYEAAWSEPVRAAFGEYEICAAGLPGMGGVNAIECLNLLELADPGPVAGSPEAFFWSVQITNAMAFSFVSPLVAAMLAPGRDASLEARTTEEWAAWLWGRMQAGRFALGRKPTAGTHSDALVAVDRWGNVAAVVHSINTGTWGETGIFVDGVSIPDAACFQQEQMATAGAGNRLPDPTNPLLVLREGRPVLASSSIGAGLHQVTAQCLLGVLEQGLDPAAAAAAPAFHLPAFGPTGQATARVVEGEFEPELLEAVRALGQPVEELSPQEARGARGYWIGVRITGSGELVGASPGHLNGCVLAE